MSASQLLQETPEPQAPALKMPIEHAILSFLLSRQVTIFTSLLYRVHNTELPLGEVINFTFLLHGVWDIELPPG